MIVADQDVTLVLTGTGDVLTPDHATIGIGSAATTLSAAKALLDTEHDAETIARAGDDDRRRRSASTPTPTSLSKVSKLAK